MAIDHTQRAKDIVTGIAQGLSDTEAMKKAGLAESTATRGLTHVFNHAPRLGEAVRAELSRWLAGGSCVPTPQERSNLVRQRLVMNLLEGKDKAVQSAKLLGQDSEVNMFEPEVRVGLQIAVAPPREWADRYAPLPDDPKNVTEE